MSRLSAPADLRERVPIQAANAFVQPFADGCFRIQAKDFAGGVIQISDSPAGIGDDDSFLDGVENGLEKTFLLREAKEIILHLLRTDPPEPADQFFEKTGFHAAASS